MDGMGYSTVFDSLSHMGQDDTYQHYIGGEWTDGESTETFDSENPATGEVLGTFQRGTEWAATGAVRQRVPPDFPSATTVRVRELPASVRPEASVQGQR